MRIQDLETPALVVDRNVMERNMDRMVELLEGKQPLDRETEAYTGENFLRRNKRPLAEDWRK